MRLVRRIMQSIRNHDWFVVAVDVSVLVLGLLLAFQADRWWEQQRDRRDERIFLEHLWNDTELNLRRLQRLQTVHEDVAAELRAAYAALEEPASLRRLEETPGFGCRMMMMPAAPLSHTAYQELIATNKLGILRDRELKLRLNEAMAAHSFVAGQLGYFRDAFVMYNQIVLPYFDVRPDPRPGRATCRIDWRALASDRLARRMLGSAYMDQTSFGRFRRDELQATQAVHDRLACLLDKPGCEAAR
jgi:hypothetical protein